MITVMWETSEGGVMTWVWEFQGTPSRTDCGQCLEHRLYWEWVGMMQRSEARPHLRDLRYQAKERGFSQAGWGDTAALRGERHTDSVLWEMCPGSRSVICKVIRLVLHVNWVKRPWDARVVERKTNGSCSHGNYGTIKKIKAWERHAGRRGGQDRLRWGT